MALFETQRLLFREFDSGDIGDLHSLLCDGEVMRHCGGVVGMPGAHRWLESAIEAYGKYGCDYWAVFEKASGKFIGQAGIMIQQIEGRSLPCLAYMIARAHWGKGYATESAAACVKYGFGALGFDAIYSTVEKENEESIHVLDKIGMKLKREIEYFGNTAYLYCISKADYK